MGSRSGRSVNWPALSSAGAALGAGVGFLAWAARGKSAQVFAPSIWQGSLDRPSLALTFDDGPSESTAELLTILESYGVRATFFQCGRNVRRLPAVTREVVAAGHEVGNHTDSHAALWLRSREFIQGELERAQTSIQEVTGSAPRFFRPPFGVKWLGLRQAQGSLGLSGVMWTVIGLDWKLPADGISRRVLNGVRNGAIVCLHDGRGLSEKPDVRETLDAVRYVLPILRDKGYHFETVSQLICPKTSSNE